MSGNQWVAWVDLSNTDPMPNGCPFTSGSGADWSNPGYTDTSTKLDLSLGYVADKWSAVLYATNACDEDGRPFIMPQMSFEDRQITLRPRAIGIRFGSTEQRMLKKKSHS